MGGAGSEGMEEGSDDEEGGLPLLPGPGGWSGRLGSLPLVCGG